MSAEERREHSRGELLERTVRWRAKQGCNPQAWESMTFPHPSLLALDALTILSRRSDAFYCLSNKVYNLYNGIPDLYELVSHSHFHFSQPGASFMLHSHLPRSMNCLERPFIWTLVFLFEYSDLFQCIIMERMNISWPVIPSIRQLHKNCPVLYTARAICGSRCYLAVCGCLLDSWSALRKAILLLIASCKKREQSR